jgi:hypothetical protein
VDSTNTFPLLSPISADFWYVIDLVVWLDCPERLDKAIHAAVHNLNYCADDCEFVLAALGWSQCISYGDFKF